MCRYKRNNQRGGIETAIAVIALAVVLISLVLFLPYINQNDKAQRANLALTGLSHYKVYVASLQSTGNKVLRVAADSEPEMLNLARKLSIVSGNGSQGQSVCVGLFTISGDCSAFIPGNLSLTGGYAAQGVDSNGNTLDCSSIGSDETLKKQLFDTFKGECDLTFRYILGVKFMELNNVTASHRIDANVTSVFQQGGGTGLGSDNPDGDASGTTTSSSGSSSSSCGPSGCIHIGSSS